ncbi:hypothetical protein ADIS_2687 [Lunatimonas lonarensis]|uniref:Uncharacterized protein n=1 Tax=Lunatimonas lonarensis TaxID=1232681 RepID=R7ZRN4_9BACT|nr:hypothetical protein ADIS_2687 [Lunatimonas lonarensis]
MGYIGFAPLGNPWIRKGKKGRRGPEMALIAACLYGVG